MVRTWGRQGPHLRMLLRMKREELSQPPPQPLNLHPEGAPGPQTPSRQVADGENRPRRRPRAGRPHTQCPLTAPTAQPAIAAVACSAQACPSQHPRAPPKHRPQTHTLPNEPPPRGQAAPADVQPRAWVGSCSGLAGGQVGGLCLQATARQRLPPTRLRPHVALLPIPPAGLVPSAQKKNDSLHAGL